MSDPKEYTAVEGRQRAIDAETATLSSADIGKLAAALDAQGYDINNAGAISADALEAAETSTKVLDDHIHYAQAYDGADPDVRLSNALSAADSGETIILEGEGSLGNAVYDSNLTVSQFGIALIAPANRLVVVDADWTLSGDSTVLNGVRFSSTGSLTLSGFRTRYTQADLSGNSVPITVSNDRCLITELNGGDVTFQSGTVDGLVDSCVLTTVTDNGTNTVGQIS